jgi:hypothetical protein
MKWKDYWDSPEEIILGGLCSTIFLYWLIGWPVFAISVVCGLLWRAGGVKDGSKLFRRLGVPFVVCGVSMFYGVGWTILLAVPFMVWLAPSYGVDSWLFKIVKNDFLARIICWAWYWSAFCIAFIATKYVFMLK